MLKHDGSGFCPKCQEILETYPNFNRELRNWFEQIQTKHVNFHISCAGRGKIDQESLFERGASRAHWKQSAHNWNMAIDTFFIIEGKYNLDEKSYAAITNLIPPNIEWYGRPEYKKDPKKFFERPHFEVKDWRAQILSGLCKLVEEMPVIVGGLH